jgi:hypothetical protein
MPRKKETCENCFDYLEEKFNVTPGQILKAIELVGPYRARLETYFMVLAFSKRKTNQLIRATSLNGPSQHNN